MTPADLERIEALLSRDTDEWDSDDYMRNWEKVSKVAPALIALARRALELESALGFLQQQPDRELARHGAVGFEVGTLEHITTAARELGWPGLQSEGGKEST